MTSSQSFVAHCNLISDTPVDFPLAYRSFACVNSSLRTTMEAMKSPKPGQWRLHSEYKENRFLESVQGVTNDGQSWFITTNGKNSGAKKRQGQGIFKYDRSMNLLASLEISLNPDLQTLDNLPKQNGSELPYLDHLGDPDYYQGKIYIPVQHPHGFLVVDSSLNSNSIEWHVGEKIGDSHPWCAVNPWNHKLYTSDFNDFHPHQTDYSLNLLAYDTVEFKRAPDFDIPLQVPSFRVQGGCFSKQGHLFLSSDAFTKAKLLLEIGLSLENPEAIAILNDLTQTAIPFEPCITVYCIVNGYFFGHIPVHRESALTFKQELEGITYWSIPEDGKHTEIHMVMLENQLGTDGVYFKHFRR